MSIRSPAVSGPVPSRMRLAIVGSTGFVDETAPEVACAYIAELLRARRPALVISGAAAGVDTWAARIAREQGIEVAEFPPRYPRWQPEGYKQRNDRMAAECTHLLRIACRWSKTYGSGYTLDRAAALGRATRALILPQQVQAGRIEVWYSSAGSYEMEVAQGRVVDGLAVRALGWAGRDADDLVASLVKSGRRVVWRPQD